MGEKLLTGAWMLRRVASPPGFGPYCGRATKFSRMGARGGLACRPCSRGLVGGVV
jgi:hypothetical protein